MGKTTRKTTGLYGPGGDKFSRSGKSCPGGTQRKVLDREGQHSKRKVVREKLAKGQFDDAVPQLQNKVPECLRAKVNPHQAPLSERYDPMPCDQKIEAKQLERRGAPGVFRGHRGTKIAEPRPSAKETKRCDRHGNCTVATLLDEHPFPGTHAFRFTALEHGAVDSLAVPRARRREAEEHRDRVLMNPPLPKRAKSERQQSFGATSLATALPEVPPRTTRSGSGDSWEVLEAPPTRRTRSMDAWELVEGEDCG